MTVEDQDIHLAFEVPVEFPAGKGSFIRQSGAPRRSQVWKQTFGNHQQADGSMKLIIIVNTVAHRNHAEGTRSKPRPGDTPM